jgi:truncated hemoglobin YjbI
LFKKNICAQFLNRTKNLAEIEFAEKADIENKIDELIRLSKDPYASSLPLIASAELGDKKRYGITLPIMIDAMNNISDSSPIYMQNNSFKAWMWGRILLAADSMDDFYTRVTAQKKLQEFLEKDFTAHDNFAFFTWAWAYRAALNPSEYKNSKQRMLDDALKLNEKDNISDALWAWVMNLQAAAYAGDQESYDWIKEQIKSITKKTTVTQALEKYLLRTTDSNDYPAWAMAKIRHAAGVMNDKELYHEIENALISSIDVTQKENIIAENILSTLDNQLAISTIQALQKENSNKITLTSSSRY